MRDELRDAWLGLRAAPGTSLLALAILTVGIAAATVTFSVVDTVALRRLPFPEPDRLVAIASLSRGSPRPGAIAPQDFFTWQAEVPAFEGVAAAAGGGLLAFDTGSGTESLQAYRITANLLDVVRVRPALGTGFTAANERAGEDQVAILSHAVWVRLFGRDPKVIGRRVALGRETRQIVGVMPPGFTYPVGPERPTDLWIPYVPRATDRDHGYAGRSYMLLVVARLRPGATVDRAADEVARATAAVQAAHPNQTFWKDARPLVTSLHQAVVGPAGRWLVLILGAVALVLVIAYVNVANLLLVRATARARELAMRTALGATRARVARMLAIESLVLSLGAAALGILVAIWGVSFATANLPAGLARASAIGLDARVLSVAIAAAVLTGLVFGAVPAWHGSRADVMTVMKEGGGAIGAGRSRARWQRALLVAELAFVVTLVSAAALFVTSFINVLRTDLGFDRGRLAGVRVSKPLAATGEGEREAARLAFVSDLLTRVRALPGVSGAALVDGGLPLLGMMASYSITVDGYGQTQGADMVVLRSVTPEYFSVAGLRMIHGRPFDDTARAGTPRVAVINDEAARRFFGGRNPVGEVFQFRGPTTVVGVAQSVRFLGPETDLRPEMYVPFLQEDVGNRAISGDVVVKLAASSAGLTAAIQDTVKAVTGGAQAPAMQDLDARFRALTADRRFNAGMMTVFGLIALTLAAAGVYGVTAFVVAQQSRAIGVRLALGATPGRIFRGVLGEAGRAIALALALGLSGGWAASRLVGSVVFGVTGGEVWLYVAVALVVATTAVAATLVPARRASRVDPLVALRAE